MKALTEEWMEQNLFPCEPTDSRNNWPQEPNLKGLVFSEFKQEPR